MAKIALTIVLVATVALAGVAWRLSRGPVDIGFVSDRIEAAVNVEGDPTRLTIGGAALAWQGFQHGVDRPLELVLTDLHVSDPTGKRQAEIARAKMTLSMGSLLLGRIVPRTFEIEGARLTVVRAADGSIGLDIGTLHEATDPGQTVAPPDPGPSPLTNWLHELARPPGTDRASNRGPLAQLRQVRIAVC